MNVVSLVNSKYTKHLQRQTQTSVCRAHKQILPVFFQVGLAFDFPSRTDLQCTVRNIFVVFRILNWSLERTFMKQFQFFSSWTGLRRTYMRSISSIFLGCAGLWRAHLRNTSSIFPGKSIYSTLFLRLFFAFFLYIDIEGDMKYHVT